MTSLSVAARPTASAQSKGSLVATEPTKDRASATTELKKLFFRGRREKFLAGFFSPITLKIAGEGGEKKRREKGEKEEKRRRISVKSLNFNCVNGVVRVSHGLVGNGPRRPHRSQRGGS
jgi:hypothetical protein